MTKSEARTIAARAVANWLAEVEVFATREERMLDDIATRPRAWIDAAASVVADAFADENN